VEEYRREDRSREETRFAPGEQHFALDGAGCSRGSQIAFTLRISALCSAMSSDASRAVAGEPFKMTEPAGLYAMPASRMQTIASTAIEKTKATRSAVYLRSNTRATAALLSDNDWTSCEISAVCMNFA